MYSLTIFNRNSHKLNPDDGGGGGGRDVDGASAKERLYKYGIGVEARRIRA